MDSLLDVCKTGDINQVELLLNLGIDLEGEWEPLHFASVNSHTGIVRLLLDRGADVNEPDNIWNKALHCASSSGHIDIVKLLLDSGAWVNTNNKWGVTPLHNAIRKRHIDVVKLLLYSGADIEKRECNNGKTPLWYASSSGCIDMVKLLINSGPSCMAAPSVRPGADVKTRSHNSTTHLHVASFYGHIGIVKLLIYSGADTKAKNSYGKTAKQLSRNSTIKAAFEQHEHMIQLKEWRPWNNFEYPHDYQHAMQTLVVLAKAN